MQRESSNFIAELAIKRKAECAFLFLLLEFAHKKITLRNLIALSFSMNNKNDFM